MSVSRLILRAANALVTFIVVIALLIAGTYSVYALWDNRQIYAEAENVKNERFIKKKRLFFISVTKPLPSIIRLRISLS